MSNDVRLQFLLRPQYRTAGAVERVQRLLEDNGFTVTGTGAATVSARTSRETIKKVFDVEVPADVKSTEGARSWAETSLSIPRHMAEYVESVTIAPQHILMNRPPASGGPDEGV